MRRMFWFALGAAVGILVYRRGQRFVEESRERGIVMTIQRAAVSASAAVESARTMVESRMHRDDDSSDHNSSDHTSKGA